MSAIVAAILGLAMKFGPAIWKAAGSAVSGGSAIAVAVVSAIPPTISAIASALDTIAKSALLSFLFGALVVGSIGFAYGLTFDAPMRERAERQAIREANRRADAAIAKIRADYETKLAALQKSKRAK